MPKEESENIIDEVIPETHKDETELGLVSELESIIEEIDKYHGLRMNQINQELSEISDTVASSEEIENLKKQKEQEYSSKIEELETGLGQFLEEESKKMIHDNMVANEIGRLRGQRDKYEDLSRLKKIGELLTPKDFSRFERTLGNLDGEANQLFNPEGKVLHTTNDFYFDKILESGHIMTTEGQEGIYGTKGASFTDGDFEEALTFQTIYDDQNSRGPDKQFNSGNYDDKVDAFIHYFWDNEERRKETKEYLSKISGGKKIETFEDAKNVAESFKFKIKPKEIENNQERLDQLHGVTIVYDKDKLPDLTQEGAEGLQKYFELRSYRKGGVPINEASTIFVPELQMSNLKQKLEQQGLSHIKIRPSEELEVARMMKILQK